MNYCGASEIHEIISGDALEPWAVKSLLLKRNGFNRSTQSLLDIGHVTEPVNDARLQLESGMRLRKPKRHSRYVSISTPFIACTPDRLSASGCPVELKFQVRGTDLLPRYWTQLQVQMYVLGKPAGVVSVLSSYGEHKAYQIRRNDEFVTEMVENVTDFWSAVVLTRSHPDKPIHPQINPGPDALDIIKRLFPEDTGETVVLPAECSTWEYEWNDIKRAKAELKAWTEQMNQLDRQENELKARIALAMGNAAIGIGPGFRTTRKVSTFTPKEQTRISINLKGENENG